MAWLVSNPSTGGWKPSG